ncbi:myb/SANT-like DNA-binding domain-containing protein 1 [Dermacentor andersoni]|uniref:myb/SANT-like DNA-binding domain-containing protein 1 n=1 Tax=Dermacentor andersoni TaxID=34620 RepID=UPI003B3B42CB
MSASDSSQTATQQTAAPPQPRTTWGERETWALISLWEEHLDHLRGERRNARVYDRIVQGLARLEIIRTRKQVQSKIDNLTQMYRSWAKKRTTGSAPVPWMYFNEIHRFLGTLPANDQSLVEESAAHSDATVEQLICSMEHGYESPNNNEDEWELEPSEAVPTSELADGAPSQRSRITNENQRRSRKRKLTSTSEFQRDLLNEQRLLRQALESATKEDRVLRERQINAQERLVGLLEQYFNKD